MAKRKTTLEYTPPKDWEIVYSIEVDGVVLNQGDTCKLKNEQGTYTFRRFVVNKSIPNHAGWVDLYGGTANYGSYRSVKIDKIKVEKPKKRRKAQQERAPGTHQTEGSFPFEATT